MECKVLNPFGNNSNKVEMFGLDFRFLAFILKPKTRERIEIDIEDRKRSSIFAAK